MLLATQKYCPASLNWTLEKNKSPPGIICVQYEPLLRGTYSRPLVWYQEMFVGGTEGEAWQLRVADWLAMTVRSFGSCLNSFSRSTSNIFTLNCDVYSFKESLDDK